MRLSSRHVILRVSSLGRIPTQRRHQVLPRGLVSSFLRIPTKPRHQPANPADPASLNAAVGRRSPTASGTQRAGGADRAARRCGRRRPTRPLECAGVIARPPLPPGPFLVVGLARSGVAAAMALRRARRRGGQVRRRSGDRRRRGRAGGGRVPVHAPAEGVDLLAAASTVVKSPGVPHQAPVIAARPSTGPARGRRARDRLAAAGATSSSWSPARTARRRRSSDRPYLPRGRGAGRRRRQRRHGADEPARQLDRRRDRRVRGVVVPARGRRGACARRGGAAQPGRGPPRPARLVRRVPGGEAAVFARPAARGARRRAASTSCATSAARPRGSRSAPGWRRRAPRRAAVVARRAADRRAGIRLRGEHNRENAMAAAAVASRAAPRPTRFAPGWGASPASRTGWRRSAASTTCSTSTTRRRPTSPSAVVAIESLSAHAVHAILGGRGKGGDYGRSPGRWPSAGGRRT